MSKKTKNNVTLNLFSQIKEEDRNLLEAKYLERKNLASMKEELKISESVLKMRLLRARRNMSDLATKQGFEIVEDHLLI